LLLLLLLLLLSSFSCRRWVVICVCTVCFVLKTGLLFLGAFTDSTPGHDIIYPWLNFVVPEVARSVAHRPVPPHHTPACLAREWWWWWWWWFGFRVVHSLIAIISIIIWSSSSSLPCTRSLNTRLHVCLLC
jgi:hypothetical protein